MKPINILFPFVGDSLGGSHISAISLIKKLPNEQFNVSVLLYQKGILSNYLDENGLDYSVLTSNCGFKKSNILIKMISFIENNIYAYKYLSDKNQDVVHTNDLRMHYSWVFACLFKGVSHFWHQRSASSRGVYLSYFSRSLVTITEYCKSTFPLMIKKKALVVNDPVSIDLSKCVKYSSFNNNNIKIAWVGNLISQKRLDTAIRVIANLKLTFPNVQLLVFGEKREPIYTEVKELIRYLGLTDNVIFMGVKTPIESWLVNCDVLLATAQNEGMGRSLIEAMLVGLPVVASDHAGHKEVVDNGVNGFLVQLENVEAYAQKIKCIISDSKVKRQIVLQAKITAKTRYSESVHSTSIISLYYELIGLSR
jgi:glycosyltransferase involved in cell wall biosynthesis